MSDREAFEAWFATASAQKEGLELGWRGIAFAAWTASRKQAMEEAAKLAEESTLRARQAKAWTNTQPMKPCEIAAAIRAAASLRKEADQC